MTETDLKRNMLKSAAYAKQSQAELHVDDGNRIIIPDHASSSELSNSGRAHTSNIASIEHRHFKHRSVSECYVTEAAVRMRILFAPLAVIGEGMKRVEPDFLIFSNKKVIFVELDGPTHQSISVELEAARLARIKSEGFTVIRFKLPPINELSLEWAMNLLKEVLELTGRAA